MIIRIDEFEFVNLNGYRNFIFDVTTDEDGYDILNIVFEDIDGRNKSTFFLAIFAGGNSQVLSKYKQIVNDKLIYSLNANLNFIDLYSEIIALNKMYNISDVDIFLEIGANKYKCSYAFKITEKYFVRGSKRTILKDVFEDADDLIKKHILNPNTVSICGIDEMECDCTLFYNDTPVFFRQYVPINSLKEELFIQIDESDYKKLVFENMSEKELEDFFKEYEIPNPILYCRNDKVKGVFLDWVEL